jgi:cell division protein FtsW
MVIAVITFILLMVGLIVIYAIGPSRANFLNSNGGNFDENYFFMRQLMSVVLAVVGFVVAYKVPFEWVKKMSGVILALGIVACMVLWILAEGGSSIVSCTNDACRWFNFGVVGFQPAELLKLGMLLYMAGLIAKRQKEGKLEKTDLWIPLIVVMAIVLVFVAVLQKDLGTAVVMMAMMFTMLLVSGMRARVLACVVAALMLLAVPLITLFPHRMARLANSGSSYHLDNALIAIGTGGFMGVGVGNSVQSTGYLPESINDSVFAIIGETFGFVGLMLVVMCFAVLLSRLLKVAQGVRDSEGSLLAAGVFAWVGAHVIINVMGMTGILPMKGITLPFLSYGGTSMMFVTIAIGLCLQLSRHTGREEKNENSSGRRGVGRPRYAHHRRS